MSQLLDALNGYRWRYSVISEGRQECNYVACGPAVSERVAHPDTAGACPETLDRRRSPFAHKCHERVPPEGAITRKISERKSAFVLSASPDKKRMGFDLVRFQGDVDEELVCPICSGVLEDPVQVNVAAQET